MSVRITDTEFGGGYDHGTPPEWHALRKWMLALGWLDYVPADALVSPTGEPFVPLSWRSDDNPIVVRDVPGRRVRFAYITNVPILGHVEDVIGWAHIQLEAAPPPFPFPARSEPENTPAATSPPAGNTGYGGPYDDPT